MASDNLTIDPVKTETFLDEANKDENAKFEQLAQEIGVTVGFLRLGYAMSGDFVGMHFPAFDSFKEFRAGVLNDPTTALLGKAAILASQTKDEKLHIGGETYDEKDLEVIRDKVHAWVAANGGSVPKKGGCYVATAIYGSYDCPQVWTLRRYRDSALSTNLAGRILIRLYYGVSPTFVKWFSKYAWFNSLLEPVLDGFVSRLNAKGFADTPYYN